MGDKIKDEKKMEEYWKVAKIESNPNIGRDMSDDKKKKNNYGVSTKKEEKEEIKNVPQNEVKKDPAKNSDRLVVNHMMGQYYPPLQPEIIPLAYRPPFICPQQNYDLFYMLQAVNQTAAINRPNIWMSKVTDQIKQTQGIDPMLPPQLNYPPAAVKPSIGANTNPGNEVISRAGTLTTVLTTSIPQSEHRHIHCEFCGHCTIRHNGHIDYIHDAELHHVDAIGEVYPHKLGITDINPDGCRPLLKYPWHADGPPSDSQSFMEGEDSENLNHVVHVYNDKLKNNSELQLIPPVLFVL